MTTMRRRMASPQRLGGVIAGIIDPKRTWYGGSWMRSRLEADFARHLDDRGIRWRYEPAVFGPRGSGYLPDFQLIRADDQGPHYVEVKPRLQDVPGAKERMAVILETYPNAVLLVVCAQASRWYASVAGAEWTTWVDRWLHA